MLPKKVICPKCKRVELSEDPLDSGQKPVPGSINICIECMYVSVFGPNMQLMAMTDEIWAQLGVEGHMEIAHCISVIITTKARYSKPSKKKSSKRRKR